ncbi:MAG: hypothetical protein ACFFA5_06030 [Promethearchaeota archaeon]
MMGLFTRNEKKDSLPTACNLSDLEVHLKYWEFVFSRFVQGATERAKKTLEKAADFISLELSQNLMKRLKNGFNGKNIQ